MEPIHGGETIFKLGQKHVVSPADYSRMTITNIYLSSSEYAVLSELPATQIHKDRHQIEHEDRIFSVDVFAAHLAGLVLAEVDVGIPPATERPLHLPPWTIREVSEDVRFTGGALARLSADQAADLIREITPPRH